MKIYFKYVFFTFSEGFLTEFYFRILILQIKVLQIQTKIMLMTFLNFVWQYYVPVGGTNKSGPELVIQM